MRRGSERPRVSIRERISYYKKGNVNIMHEVPNDNQVKDMLKGKTAKEKMVLLQEIEKARQAKMHLDYLLQMEQINHAERWAKRNVDERDQIMAMY